MDVSILDALAPDQLREVLPQFLSSFVDDPILSERNLQRVSAQVADWPQPLCAEVLTLLQDLRGGEERLHCALPACRALSRAWTRDVLTEVTCEGVEHLEGAIAAGPAIIVCNHLSYFDANAADAVLAWTGHVDAADRLVAAAGPKVYQDLFRLVAAACIHTLSVPQSTTLSHTAKLSPRDLARRAHASLDAAAALAQDGLVLLIYPEGSRTRSGRLGSFVKGVHRYLGAVEGLQVVPAAIDGTDAILPVGQTKLTPGPVRLSFGPPLTNEGSSRDLLARAHGAVAALLPPRLEPPAGHPPVA